VVVEIAERSLAAVFEAAVQGVRTRIDSDIL
jgi:hypothetical protein